jgi:hypothetical protein
MGELSLYSLTLLLTIRIGLQAMMLLFVIDSYRNSRMRHAIYATAVYAAILVAWLFDAIVHFSIIPMSDFTVFLQDGVLPLLISICLVILAVSSKTRKEKGTWIQR